MSLFLGPMRHHIPGKKELSDHKDILNLLPKKEVYLPLIAGNNTNFNVLVQEGDRVKVGTKLAETASGFYIPIYSSVSGTYKGCAKRMHSSLKPQMHMIIELDGLQESVPSFEPLDYQSATWEQCVDFIKNAGIVGLGGAGFPAYIKYSKPNGIDALLINAVECEPYITADYKMIQSRVQDLVTGCLILQKMATCNVVYICIKESHPDLIDLVKKAVSSHSSLQVKPVPDVYPMGWERVLVREVLHKEYDRLPAEAGAIVSNATTAIATAQAFEKGQAIVSKMVTVSGEGVKNPMNVYVPVGTCVKEIMEACGGYTSDSVRLIAGGPMMGKTVVNELWVVDRATNAITVLPHVADDAIACLRCGKCSDHCPAGLQPVRIAQAVQANNLEEMEKRGALSCIECGLCSYNCPSHIDVTENVRKAKRVLMMKKK
ncbi:RnfABCDGE type electron transport complex subunit C [Floccifex sp.]|uniref:RnfABCDGE type electron transport complex subunit C n=1 Tax=Floccifex sp. TaxID=2815810 RepID=UPI003F0E99EE